MQERGISKPRSGQRRVRSRMKQNFPARSAGAAEMAQRSTRRFLNLISVEVFQGRLANKEESGRIPSWPGVTDSTKGRIHWRRPNCHSRFRLQFCGGPYIPIFPISGLPRTPGRKHQQAFVTRGISVANAQPNSHVPLRSIATALPRFRPRAFFVQFSFHPMRL